MLADFLARVWPALPLFFLAGCCFVLGGLIWLVVIRRTEVTMGPDPQLPPAPGPHPLTVPSLPAPANYRRADADTGVIPQIPGATPQAGSTGIETDQVKRVAGPVCPFCGGPWHALCPSAPKERTEQTPEHQAFVACVDVIDEATHLTNDLLRRASARLRPDPVDDCPLTTVEIPTLDPALPLHDATVRASDTRDLTVDIAAILKRERVA